MIVHDKTDGLKYMGCKNDEESSALPLYICPKVGLGNTVKPAVFATRSLAELAELVADYVRKLFLIFQEIWNSSGSYEVVDIASCSSEDELQLAGGCIIDQRYDEQQVQTTPIE